MIRYGVACDIAVSYTHLAAAFLAGLAAFSGSAAFFLQHFFLAGASRSTAVSYTHLDVYKRQARSASAQAKDSGSLMPSSISAVSLSEERHSIPTMPCPVSYTHLDVYKRQTYSFQSSNKWRGFLTVLYGMLYMWPAKSLWTCLLYTSNPSSR